jgi:ribosomal protein L37AE/L43A
MGLVYVGAYRYQCTYCQRTNLRRIAVSAETLEEANRTVRSRVLPCGACMKKQAEGAIVTIEMRRALPGETPEGAEEQGEKVEENKST